MSSTPNHFNIIVTGDVTLDWHLARSQPGSNGEFIWNPDYSTRACWQRGGAALLGDFMEVITRGLASGLAQDYALFIPQTPNVPVDPADPTFHHAYAIWSRYQEGNQTVWRVAEFLGIDRCIAAPRVSSDRSPDVDGPSHVDFLLIDDAALGFREAQESWPGCLQDRGQNFWILLKMSQPVGRGPLWEHLLAHFSERLIVLTTASDLRRTEVQISKGLSWERTAQDLVWEIMHNPQINALSRSACLVVSFGVAGAVIHTRIPNSQESAQPISTNSQLVFDPAMIEGMWEEYHPGGMIGYLTCLAGGIAQHIVRAPGMADILPGVQAGLEAMRDLHRGGYENKGSLERPSLSFPLEQVAHKLAHPKGKYAVINIQDPIRFLTTNAGTRQRAPAGGYWTILHDRYQGDLDEVCTRIVLEGAETTLTDVPQGIFGKLFTVDRQEIENFRSLATLADEYLSQARPERPLSIAVFGAPGSGKSFGITQVAESLAPGRIHRLEFNLSQFETTDELDDALHQVRDVNLSGKFPLVFWDEFDTTHDGQPLGWLRYFLAPMQDGSFNEGQIVRPIGPAIFVFAGGTSHRMSTFGQGLDEETFRAAKVPDFISRLKGFVNVLGLNPEGDSLEGAPSADPFYLLRRAILLRSILWLNARHLFHKKGEIHYLNIDKGVLYAFLKTRFYKHGIRSMEAIVAMSQLAEQTRFERSSLPTATQLDLHVDGQEFLALVQQIELSQETLNKLAILFHENFCAQLVKQGYVYGRITDSGVKTHSSLVDFHDLPEHEQEQNRDTVRHMQSKLAASGYIMIPARSNEPAFEFPGELLEELAIMEHNRWVKTMLEDGWQPAAVIDKEKKLHTDLGLWEEVSELAKEMDRAFVLAIPKVLARAGYTVVELRDMNAGG